MTEANGMLPTFTDWIKRNWKMVAGISVSIICLYFAFGNIDWGKLWAVLKGVDYFKIFIAMAIIGAMLFVRGHRWSLFLKPVKKIPAVPLFWSTSIGFGVNNVLPARLGEVARAYSIYKKKDVPFGSAFGTIVVERLYDTFSILILFVICLFTLDFPDLSQLLGRSEQEVGVILTAMVAILLSGVLLLKLKTEMMLGIAAFFLRPFPKGFSEKIQGFFRNFIKGLTQTVNPLEMVWIIIISFGLWLTSAYTVWLIVDACNIDLNFSQTMVVLMSLVIAVSIPAAPGYAGTYHILCRNALMLVAGIPKEEALAIATLIHATNYIPQTALGLGALMYEGIAFSDVKRVKQRLEQEKNLPTG